MSTKLKTKKVQDHLNAREWKQNETNQTQYIPLKSRVDLPQPLVSVKTPLACAQNKGNKRGNITGIWKI